MDQDSIKGEKWVEEAGGKGQVVLGASILERNCAAAITPARPAHRIPHCLRSHPNKRPLLQQNVLKRALRSAGNPAAVHQTAFVSAGVQSWREVIGQTNDNGGESRGGCFKTGALMPPARTEAPPLPSSLPLFGLCQLQGLPVYIGHPLRPHSPTQICNCIDSSSNLQFITPAFISSLASPALSIT